MGCFYHREVEYLEGDHEFIYRAAHGSKKKKKRLFYRDWLMRSMRDMSIDYLLLSEE